MDRVQIIAALAVLLFGSFVLGFLTHWIVTRLSRVSHRDLDELDNMAEALHTAEITRDEAIAERHRIEHDVQRETAQARTDLRAALDGLGEARAEAAELRAYITKHRIGQR